MVSTNNYDFFSNLKCKILIFLPFPALCFLSRHIAGKVETEPINQVYQLVKRIRFRCEGGERNAFVKTICDENGETLWTEFENFVISDVNQAVSLLVSLILRVAWTMVVKNNRG